MALTGTANYFEDFAVGQVFRHARGKTMCEQDNVGITLQVLNTAEAHFNEHLMEQNAMGRDGWNRRVQFGGVTISMIVGMTMQDTGENALAELGLDRIRLKAPVFHGDTLYAYTEVLDVAALNGLAWKPKTLCVRINDVETPWCHDDVIEVVSGAGDKLDTIMLTKAKRAEDVVFVHLLLDQLEAKLGLERRIGIECLIEEVEGMMNVEAIAACSDRLECLIFGMGDYSASQQMQLGYVGSSGTYPPDVWHYPRYRMTIACHANSIDPVDGPYANFRNSEGYNKEAERAYVLGMVGKWAIHPSQVELANAVFTPDEQAVADARKQKAAYEEALEKGQGAINVDGVMVDAASIRIVQNLIDRADLIGM